MKKYFIFAAAVAFTACTEDTLIDNTKVADTKEVAIGFGTGMNNMTRAENSSAAIGAALEYYHPAFGVWGYKTVGTGDEQTVFNDQACTWTTTSVTEPFTATGDWVYSPIRYWDKTALYDFYAYAPATAAFAINTPTSGSGYPSNHYLTLSEFSVDGKSLAQDDEPTGQYTAADAAYDLFADEIANNKDLMIADDVIDASYIPQRVQLNFNHILSRLNINIKTNIPAYVAESGTTPASGATVTLNSIQIKNMIKTGAFDESKAYNTTSSSALSDGTAARWTLTTTAKYDFGVTFTTTSGTVSATSDNYVSTNAAPTASDMNVIPYSTSTANVDKFFYQGLIMPQTVECENVPLDGTAPTGGFTTPYLVIDYTIKYSETESETNVAYYNLAAVMSNGFAQYADVNGNLAFKTANPDVYLFQDASNNWYTENSTSALSNDAVAMFNGSEYYDAKGTTRIYKSGDKFYSDAACETEITTPTYFLTIEHNALVPVTKAEADVKAGTTGTAKDLCDFTFCEGWQNNLTITISPLAILFDANVYKWADRSPVGPLTIE